MKKLFLMVALLLPFTAVLAPFAYAINKSQVVISSPRVVVYGAPWCGACKSLTRKLAKLGVKYTYIDIDKNPQSGISFIPVMKINGKSYTGDMSLSELKRLLDIR